MDELLTGISANGPWAAMAGFLLWQLLKERSADKAEWAAERKATIQLMTEFRVTLEKLSGAVVDLTNETRRNSQVLEKITNEVPH